MGDDQVGVIDNRVADEQDIDVEGPWSPPLLANPLGGLLSGPGESKELAGRPVSYSGDTRMTSGKLTTASRK
jgi:hypothetical protein